MGVNDQLLLTGITKKNKKEITLFYKRIGYT